MRTKTAQKKITLSISHSFIHMDVSVLSESVISTYTETINRFVNKGYIYASSVLIYDLSLENINVLDGE